MSAVDILMHPASITIGVIAIITAILKFGEWRGAVNSDRTIFTSFIEEMRNDYKEIRDKIEKIFDRLPDSTATATSPIRLTELGKKVSNDINATTLAEQLVETLKDKVVNKNAYEIQELCFNYMEKEFHPSPDQLNEFEVCAFQRGIKVYQVHRVIGLELRDKLLKLTNQNVDDIDD